MDVNRRNFFKLGAVASCVAVGGNALANEEFGGWPNSYGLLFDSTLCLGADCRLCEKECKRTNERKTVNFDVKDNSVFEKERRTDAENYTIVNRYQNLDKPSNPIYVKRQCMHCAEPACASACLVKAFTKSPEGAVVYNPDVCIGCRYCMVACPFNAPAYDYFDAYSPQVQKCTMCVDRIREGKKPACVEICPRETITFGKRDDLIKLAREKIRNHPDKYNEHIYGEHEVGGTSWLYLAGTDFSNIGFDTSLGTTEYPKLTRGFLSAVPMVLTIWPVFLVGLYKATQHREKVKQLKQTVDQKENI